MASQLTYRPEQVAALLAGKSAPPPKPPVLPIETALVQAHTTYRALVRALVQETKAISDEQEYRYVAGLTNELVRLAGAHLLSALEEQAQEQRAVTRRAQRS